MTHGFESCSRSLGSFFCCDWLQSFPSGAPRPSARLPLIGACPSGFSMLLCLVDPLPLPAHATRAPPRGYTAHTHTGRWRWSGVSTASGSTASPRDRSRTRQGWLSSARVLEAMPAQRWVSQPASQPARRVVLSGGRRRQHAVEISFTILVLSLRVSRGGFSLSFITACAFVFCFLFCCFVVSENEFDA